jgi:hypothetical protein
MAGNFRFVSQTQKDRDSNFCEFESAICTHCDKQRTVQMFKPFVELKNG